MDRERVSAATPVTSSFALTQAAEGLPQICDQVVRPLHRRKVPARGELRLATPVAVDDGLYDVTIRGASAEILADELAGWGRDIEVLGPAAVRRCLARIGAELVALYGVDRSRP